MLSLCLYVVSCSIQIALVPENLFILGILHLSYINVNIDAFMVYKRFIYAFIVYTQYFNALIVYKRFYLCVYRI